MAAANPGMANKAGQLVLEEYASARISSATTTLVKTGPGLLSRIVVDTNLDAKTITIYDALSATGTPIAIITTSGTVPFSLDLGIPFAVGLCVVTNGSTGVIVLYR